MMPTRRSLMLLCLLAPALVGCATGSRTHAVNHREYNESFAQTEQEQLLLNIVRLRYGERPNWLTVGSIATQHEWNYGGSIGGNVASSNSSASFGNFLNLGAQAAFAERPTIAYLPNAKELMKGLVDPVTPESLFVLSFSRWPLTVTFSLLVDEINGIQNARTGGGPTPITAPEFGEFVWLMHNLGELERRNLVELVRESRLDPVSGPLPIETVSAEELRNANESSYAYVLTDDKESLVLNKKRSAIVLRFAPAAMNTPEKLEIDRMLGLDPHASEYELTIALEGHLSRDRKEGILKFDDPRPVRLPPTHATASEIRITTRSLRHLLFLFSQGVDVPLCHLQQGIVVTTLNPDNTAFDWQQVLRGLFHISVSESKPKCAAAAVPYRGYWFFIDERDHGTKNSLLLLDELGTIQIEAGGEENLPILTLPLGG